MKYLEDNFGCSYNLPINIVKVHIFPVDGSDCKMHLTPSRSISINLYSNVFIGLALHIAILPACQRNTFRRFWVSVKVFYHQIRWWFQHDVSRSFSRSNQAENFKRSLRIDFFLRTTCSSKPLPSTENNLTTTAFPTPWQNEPKKKKLAQSPW